MRFVEYTTLLLGSVVLLLLLLSPFIQRVKNHFDPLASFVSDCRSIKRGASIEEIKWIMRKYEISRERPELIAFRLNQNHSADICFVEAANQVAVNFTFSPD